MTIKMILTEESILTRKELAEFFEIKPESFSKSREKYLEDLKDYADYELNLTTSGKFKNVKITNIYCDTYYKSYKKDFIAWLDNNDVFELTGEGGYSNYSIITNHYCSLKGIPFEGAHYVYQEFIGKTEEAEGQRVRTVKESQKIPNAEFKIWHYLRSICKNHLNCVENKFDYVDMKSETINPIYLNIMTEEDRKKYDEIAYEIYGNQAGNMYDTKVAIEEMDVDTMTARDMQQEILNLRSMRDMSSQEKRQMFMDKLMRAGLLKHKGYGRRSR